MPIGKWENFQACVDANQDKDSPERFCAALEKKITGEWPAAKRAASALLERVMVAFKSEDAEALTVGVKQGNIQAILDTWPDWADSYTRCVEVLTGKEGIETPEALCAWLHHGAKGAWPGEKSHEGIALAGMFVSKSAQRQIATAPVLVPGERDSDGEVLTAEKIEEVALKWMEEYGNVDVLHSMNNAAFPEQVFIMGHCNLTAPETVFALAKKHPNVYADMSFQSASNIRRAFKAMGEDRVLYASDCPFSLPKYAVKVGMDATRHSNTLREKFFCKNAETLIGALP